MLNRCDCGTIIPEYATFCDCCAYIETQETELIEDVDEELEE